MEIRLYLICFRTEALVASHLPPEQFGNYMAVGTQKRNRGNVLFLEIDPTLRSPELNLQHLEARCVPHEDGSPRRSKYMSVYRVIEHLPLSALGKLYLTSRDGRVLGLDGMMNSQFSGDNKIHMYAELCPLTPRVVSRLNPAEFTLLLTSLENAVRVPRIFFADTKIDRDSQGHLSQSLPYADREHIEDCLNELEANPQKASKTVDRNPSLQGFFNTIDSGFYVGDPTGTRHYAFPDQQSLERDHYNWWRSASLS